VWSDVRLKASANTDMDDSTKNAGFRDEHGGPKFDAEVARIPA
jgi:hypothetical protein